MLKNQSVWVKTVTHEAVQDSYHITSHRTQRSLDLEKNEVMRAIKSYLVVLLVDLQAAHPNDPRFVNAKLREFFPLSQDPRVLAEGIMERANKQTLEAPLKEKSMALAKELGQKSNQYLDPEELSNKLQQYFDDIGGMDDGEDFLSEFHAVVNQHPDANHARQVNNILRI